MPICRRCATCARRGGTSRGSTAAGPSGPPIFFSTPRANLEVLYGGGPVGSPYLFSRADGAKLLAPDGDVPRNQEGVALIGDPRNDVHVFVSQMQVAFIAAHNLLVDRLREDGVAEAELFDEARRALTWHYQWLIVNEL